MSPQTINIIAWAISLTISICLVVDNMLLRKQNQKLNNQIQSLKNYMHHANTESSDQRGN